MNIDNQPVNLLWTGGWDSTFRICQLLIQQKRPVQPHYLLSMNRKSLRDELVAMNNIKQLLYTRYPYTKDLLCPTVFFDIFDLPEIPEITKSFLKLRERTSLGPQYEWLAKYVLVKDLQDLEMGIQAGGRMEGVLNHVMIATGDGFHRTYKIGDQYQDTDEYILFHRFLFPIFDVSKINIEKIVREENWFEVLKLTWFCHQPLPNHIPCGTCHPCCIAMEKGMSWRLPRISKMRYYATLRFMSHKKPFVYRVASKVKHLFVPG